MGIWLVRPVAATMAATFFTIAEAQPVADPANTLPPVTVRAPADSYTVPDSSAGSRTNTPVEQIPQSIVIIPRKVIEDQGVLTISDALRNVSNVSAIDKRDENNATFRIRGFSSALVVDGVPMQGYFPNKESLANVERIDVIKGPAGNLFGSPQAIGSFANLGGTIAITTSEPVQRAVRQIGVRAGNFGELGATFDFNQAITPTVAFRMVGDFGKSDSETDRVFFRKTALFPSLAWTPNANTKVVLRLRYLDDATLDYSGLPPTGTLLGAAYAIPRSRVVTAEGLPDTANTAKDANLQWTQQLSAAWKFGLTLAYNETEVDQRGVFPFPFGGAGPFHFLAGARLWDQWKTTTISPSLTGKLTTGAFRHTLNVGVDYEKTRDDAFLTFSNGIGLLSFLPVDLRNPVYPAWAEPAPLAVPDQQNRYQSTVFYAQDQIDVGNWHLLLGLRQSRIKVDDVNPATFVNNHSTVNKLTPRVGAVYEFTPWLSAFAGYSTGIKTPTISVFSRPPKPEESQQKEIGLRLKNLWGITATLAWFDLTRSNVAVADPVNIGFSIQAGKQRSRGTDLDLVWQTNESLRWILAYSQQSAKLVEDTVLPVGSQLFNVPRTTARLAMRYDFQSGGLRGLGLGLGVTHHSQLPGDNRNTFFTPESTVWDAQASYRVGSARFGLVVRNLADRKYWVPSTYFGGGQVIPAQPRTVMATANFSF